MWAYDGRELKSFKFDGSLVFSQTLSQSEEDDQHIAVVADGGWTLDAAHFLESSSKRTLNGDGKTQNAWDVAETIMTMAGTGTRGTTVGTVSARDAQIDTPHGIEVGPDGAIYFSEYLGNSIRKIDAEGKLAIVAGEPGQRGLPNHGNGGPATSAKLYRPRGIAFVPDGSLSVAEEFNYTVRAIAPDGAVYVAEYGNHVIRRIGRAVPDQLEGQALAGRWIPG